MWSLGLFGLLGLVGVLGAFSGNSAEATLTWGRAITVPGTATLNRGGEAGVGPVSCATAGNCVAGGTYNDGHGHDQAFVVDQTNGSWSNAIEVPGTATLNSGGYAEVNSVSCAAAGDCTAGGVYIDGSNHAQAFVVDETNGSWGTAIEAPGTATLNSAGSAAVESVSCATAGNCVAGGLYADAADHAQAFVVEETDGSWGTAIEVPGTATLNSGDYAYVNSVSCATSGNCAAVGAYLHGSDRQAFVIDETDGSWGTAIEVPGTATLNSGGNTQANSVSCAAAGNCTAGGYYTDGSGHYQAFVVDETNGSWGTAIEVPGTAALNTGGAEFVVSVSCGAAGTCAAGGFYDDGDRDQPFVVDETNGSWGTAIEVPGAATLYSGGVAEVNSVSCAAAGDCTAGGEYDDASENAQAFVAAETNGSWGTAIKVPGSGSYAVVNSISCAAADVCLAGGYYASRGRGQAFVASSGTRALTVPSAPHLKSAVPGNKKIKATWSKPTDGGGVPIAGYRATAKAGSQVFTCSTKSTLSCTIAGLKDGTTYTVTAVATNTVGRSPLSNSKRTRPRT